MEKSIYGTTTGANPAVQADEKGGFTVLGSTWIKNRHGKFDIWLAHLDTSGNVLDEHVYGTRGSDDENSLLTATNGHVIGGWQATGSTKSAWTLYVDRAGRVLWEDIVNKREDNEVVFLSEDFDANAMVVGVTRVDYWDNIGWVRQISTSGELIAELALPFSTLGKFRIHDVSIVAEQGKKNGLLSPLYCRNLKKVQRYI